MLYKNKYRIESTRLPKWNYASPGFYFLTFCTKNRIPFFGKIKNQKMEYSKIGEIAISCMQQIPDHFPNAIVDEFIIMPEHVHVLIKLNEEICHGKSRQIIKTDQIIQKDSQIINKLDQKKNKNLKNPNLTPPQKGTISLIINHYKGAVKRWCNKNAHQQFSWQPGFYDRIVLNRVELYFVREYIKNNPKKY